MPIYDYRCIQCGIKTYFAVEISTCPECGGNLQSDDPFNGPLPIRGEDPFISVAWLELHNACDPGIKWFSQTFSGLTYASILLERLRAKGKTSWRQWLLKHLQKEGFCHADL